MEGLCLYCDGRAVLALARAAQLGLPAIPAAAAGLLLNLHKTPTSLKLRKDGRGQLSMYSMTASWREQL